MVASARFSRINPSPVVCSDFDERDKVITLGNESEKLMGTKKISCIMEQVSWSFEALEFGGSI